jgi:uncharacterized protein YdbL (DUF1318 family)
MLQILPANPVLGHGPARAPAIQQEQPQPAGVFNFIANLPGMGAFRQAVPQLNQAQAEPNRYIPLQAPARPVALAKMPAQHHVHRALDMGVPPRGVPPNTPVVQPDPVAQRQIQQIKLQHTQQLRMLAEQSNQNVENDLGALAAQEQQLEQRLQQARDNPPPRHYAVQPDALIDLRQRMNNLQQRLGNRLAPPQMPPAGANVLNQVCRSNRVRTLPRND